MAEATEYEDFWQAIVRRVFPGSLSNHHLGTLLGMLLAAYEMNAFKADFQRAIIANAKAFARALKDQGLHVEGNPGLGYTETHQIILRVGYGRGPIVAEQMEENNIIVNYQAAPDDEGFTTSSCLRMGVQEMTRFGMREADFGELAGYMADFILRGKAIKEEVARFRKRFLTMGYCLSEAEAAPHVERLIDAIR
jgi:aminomethyltransferase